MFKFNLKILLRSIRNKSVYSLISIIGFTFGITASLFIYFWVLDELSFEKFHPNHQQIYCVLTLSKQGDKIVKSTSSYDPVLNYRFTHGRLAKLACSISKSGGGLDV